MIWFKLRTHGALCVHKKSCLGRQSMTYFGVLLIHYLPCVSTADASIFFGATRRKTRQCNQLQVQWEMASSSIPKHSTKSFFPLSPWIYSRIFFSLPGRFFFLNCEVWKKKYISMSTFRWTQLDGSTPTTSAVQASGTIWKHLARRDILPFFHIKCFH